jgi:hypothetical protein
MVEPMTRFEWPSGDGKPVALIRREPGQLAEQFGFIFVEDVDDVDYLQYSTIRLASGEPILLMRHRSSPVEGIEVYADSAANVEEVVSNIRADLELTSGDFTWQSDEP